MFSKKKHIHCYDIRLVKTYAPPIVLTKDTDLAEVTNEMALGVTTLITQCECGECKVYQLLGSEVSPVDDVENVDYASLTWVHCPQCGTKLARLEEPLKHDVSKEG